MSRKNSDHEESQEDEEGNGCACFLAFLALIFVSVFVPQIGPILVLFVLIWSPSAAFGPPSKYKELAQALGVASLFALPLVILNVVTPFGPLVLKELVGAVRNIFH